MYVLCKKRNTQLWATSSPQRNREPPPLQLQLPLLLQPVARRQLRAPLDVPLRQLLVRL
jgi:hypothetical protein